MKKNVILSLLMSTAFSSFGLVHAGAPQVVQTTPEVKSIEIASTLETENTQLRRVTREDALTLFSLMKKDASVLSIIGSLGAQGLEQVFAADAQLTDEDRSKVIEMLFVAPQNQGMARPWLVERKADKAVIGLAGFSFYDQAEDSVGLFCLCDRQDATLLQEAEKAVIDYALADVGFDFVYAPIDAQDQATQDRFAAYGFESRSVPFVINLNVTIPRNAKDEEVRELEGKLVQRLQQELAARREMPEEVFVYVISQEKYESRK